MTTREFRTLRFNFYNYINKNLEQSEIEVSIAEKVGPSIKRLEAVRSYIHIYHWIAIIKKMKNIEVLKVIATRLIFPNDFNDPIDPGPESFKLNDADIPHLPSLKHVHLKDCSELLFKFLSKSSLQEISVSLKTESVLKNLLTSQPKIRKIHNIVPFNVCIFKNVCDLKHLVELDLDLSKTEFKVKIFKKQILIDYNYSLFF